MVKEYKVEKLETSWNLDKRWAGIERPYCAEDVVRLRGSIQIEHTLARMGAERLWRLLHKERVCQCLWAHSAAIRRCRWCRRV
jgi:isocitrate lyase